MIYHKIMVQMINRRTTKYTNDILGILRDSGHATNMEIATKLRHLYPEVSDTTVHRVTQRLFDDGVIGLAPKTQQGCLRYDISPQLHDHFICSNCDNLRDIIISVDVREQIKCQVGDCLFDGPLTITGTCKKCQK